MNVQIAPSISPPRQPAHRRSAQFNLPPFEQGDRLSRAEFERRYQAYPNVKKAELIEGVVYMPSPVRFDQHAQPHFLLIGWLSAYCAATPGVQPGGDNATVRLDMENEVQPDALLRLEADQGGRSQIAQDGYLEGPPELVVEIVASSASYDLHDKRRVYARSGVPEYLAVQMHEQRADWFILREGVYDTLQPDENGVLRSETFPGLWLQPSTIWSADLAGMLAVLQRGLASPEHAALVERLQAA